MLRLYIDEDSAQRALARMVRAAGIDCTTALEARMLGATDEDQLEHASASGRVLFSANRRDFVRIHTEWANTGRTHPGIVLLARRETPIARVVAELTRIAREWDPIAIQNALLFINRG